MAAIQAWQNITSEDFKQSAVHVKDMQQNTKHDYFHFHTRSLLQGETKMQKMAFIKICQCAL